jgi:S1-C subfamily serine protease
LKRTALYSSSGSRSGDRVRPYREPDILKAVPPGAAETPRDAASAKGKMRRRVFERFRRYERPLLVVTGGLLALLLVFFYTSMQSAPHRITQSDIDAAVLHTLETKPLPSLAARAYDLIRPSVVSVRGFGRRDGGEKADTQTGIGSGVVIVDSGVILTNLHVVYGAEQVKVKFADGLESNARIIGLQPEHDLAVLQAETIPDDLVPATLRSTHDLMPGDQVIAVGFPFGIGPSVSSGVVSGLQREFRSPEGQRLLTNLIQFDAAANPGNSGGPLVTPDGAVVGIVTAILNPGEQRVFVGIGFAVPIENAASAVGIHPF